MKNSYNNNNKKQNKQQQKTAKRQTKTKKNNYNKVLTNQIKVLLRIFVFGTNVSNIPLIF